MQFSDIPRMFVFCPCSSQRFQDDYPKRNLDQVFSGKHYKIGWMTFQNCTVGLINQMGDAWDPNKFLLKKSLGIQLRINGFSFYNFPTAIELEYHQPLNKFERVINDENISYGERGRAYAKILFDF